MEIFLQSFKNVFLLLTTIGFVIISLRSSYKGLLFYMACLILCAFTGFERAVYYEGYLVPGVLLFKTLFAGRKKIDAIFALLFLYVISISLVNNLNPFPLSNPIFFGIVLLAIKDNILTDERKRLMMIVMLWLYIFAKMIWYMIYSPDPFAIKVLGDRLLEVNSRLVTGSDTFRGGLDPNYFGYVMGAGSLMSLLGVLNFNKLRPYVKHSWVKYILLAVAAFELFFSLKGLSRGVFIAEVGAISLMFFLYFGRNSKYVAGVIIIFVIFVFFSGVWDLLYSRFIASNSASRFMLAKEVLSSMYEWNGALGYITGGGTDFSWNKYSSDPFLRSFPLYSTHSSWLTLFVNYGVIGFGLFAVVLFQKLKSRISSLKASWFSRSMLVLFVYFALISMSLEPLQSFYGWLLLIAII